MRSYILVAGTTLALSAAPAFAGGPGLGRMIGATGGPAGGASHSGSRHAVVYSSA